MRKNPGAHWLHAVPLAAVVNPAVQVQLPLASQTPLTQLQEAGAPGGVVLRQRPLPVRPSSQSVQPLGQAAQVGPKKPGAQLSHEAPVKPAAHAHVPAAVHMPDEAHGGEHAADWRSKRVSELGALVGSCAVSGIESQMMTRELGDAGDSTEIQTLAESATERAFNGVEELAPMGALGMVVNPGLPEYSDPE